MTEPESGVDPARAALARVRAGAPRRARRATAPSAAPAAGEDRDPRPLAAALHELVADRGWQDTVSATSVTARWAELVGPEVAAHCTAQHLDADGVLTVSAESTAWATQLRLLSRSILDQLRARLGPGVVRTLRVQGPVTASWQHGPRRVRGARGPRDTYG